MNEVIAPIDLALMDWSAVSSLGDDAGVSHALWRAGLCNLEATRFVDEAGNAVRMCLAPRVDGGVDGVERLIRLATPALQDLLDRMDAPSMVARVVLCVPDWLDRSDKEQLVDGLRGRGLLPRASWEWVQAGRSSGAKALIAARSLVQSGRQVLWGGVDTWHHWPILEALLARERLLTDERVDALRPGEAAAFALLGPPDKAHVRCVGLGLAQEPSPLGHPGPSRGEGLVQAVRLATARLRSGDLPCRTWYLDSTHESYATRELQFLIARCADLIGDGARLHQPLHDFGDVGAASMPMLCALAAQAAMDAETPQPHALVTGSADDGGRGAMLLVAPSAVGGARP